MSVTSDSNSNVTYTLPLTFTNNCFQVICVDDGDECVNYGVTSMSASDFTCYVKNSDGSSRANTNTGCIFVAIGN